LLPQVEFNRFWMVASLGLLGTTISPYMLFWQAGEEVEELRQGITIQAKHEDAGVWLGMIYSTGIAFFVLERQRLFTRRGQA